MPCFHGQDKRCRTTCPSVRSNYVGNYFSQCARNRNSLSSKRTITRTRCFQTDGGQTATIEFICVVTAIYFKFIPCLPISSRCLTPSTSLFHIFVALGRSSGVTVFSFLPSFMVQ